MSTHLNDEQISKWIAGASTAEEQQHCRECALCRTSITSFQNDLSSFGGAITYWADKQRIGSVPDVQRAVDPWHQARMRPLRWVTVAAVLAIVAGIPAYKRTIDREREIQAARESELDAQLLDRVNTHLSRTAPASLQPLMEMQKEGDHR
jgi:hypothetical protein